MKIKQFDEIYMVFAKEPLTQITTSILAKMFRENKKFLFDEKQLELLREQKRPEII